MECCRTDCIERPLSRLFMKVGRIVGSYPIWFFIISMLISAGLGAGFYFLKAREANDIEDQFTPVNGPAKQERSFIKDSFPYNMSMFSSQRLYTEGTFASLIITLTNEENILTKEAFEEIIFLNKQIQEISVDDGKETFLDLCARAYGQCVPNAIFQIIGNNASNIVNTKIKFPQHPAGGELFFLGTTVGGVNVDAGGFLQSAQAIRLYYYLKEDTESKAKAASWLKAFLSFTAKLKVRSTTISRFTSLSRQQEMERNTDDVIPLFSITYFLAITFSITSCMRFVHV